MQFPNTPARPTSISQSVYCDEDEIEQRPPVARRAWGWFWLLTLLAGLLGATLAAGLGLALPAKYRASAQIMIEPPELKALADNVSAPVQLRMSATDPVGTRALRLGSDERLHDVIEALDLADDPEFNGTASHALTPYLAWIKAQLPTGPQPAAPSRDAVVLDTLRRALVVDRVGSSNVIETSIVAQGRDKGRKILATLINADLRDETNARAEIVVQPTVQTIDPSIGKFENRIALLEQQLADYDRQRKLVAVPPRSAADQELSDLSTQLDNARAVAAQRQRSVRLVPNRARELVTISGTALSPRMRVLHQRMVAWSAREARLSAQLLPAHPDMQSFNDRGRQLRADITRKLGRIKRARVSAYRRARQRVAVLSARLEKLQTETLASDRANNKLHDITTKFRAVRQQLAAARDDYRHALRSVPKPRVKTPKKTAKISVISKPQTDTERAFPPPTTGLAAAGFALGGALGSFLLFCAGFLRKRRTQAITAVR